MLPMPVITRRSNDGPVSAGPVDKYVDAGTDTCDRDRDLRGEANRVRRRRLGRRRADRASVKTASAPTEFE